MGKETAIKLTSYQRSTELIKNRFNHINNIVDTILVAGEPLSQVQNRNLSVYIKELTVKRQEFERNLHRVLDDISAEEASNKTLSDDQNLIQDLFAQITGKIETLLPQAEEPSSPFSTSSRQTSFHLPELSTVRLPKLELKHFSGDPLAWISFFNIFDTTIHKNTSLNNVAKFQYLLSALSGEPLSLIKSLTLSAANYVVAYDLLKERYHSPRRLVTLHLNQVIDLPNIASSGPKQMRSFVNSFYEHTQALKALDCDIASENPLLVALILRKMDTHLRTSFEAYRSTRGLEGAAAHSLPQVLDIIKFLNEECAHIEDASLHAMPRSSQASKPMQPSVTHKPNFNRVHLSTQAPQNVALTATSAAKAAQPNNAAVTNACFDCGQQTHKIYSCPHFKLKTPQQRYKIVKNNNRCVSCLGNHSTNKCTSRGKCFVCQKRHHTTLHFENNQNVVQASPSNHDAADTGHNFVKAETLCDSSSVSMTSQVNSKQPEIARNHSTVLLSTALIKLTTSERKTHVFRALLDSGSMCNFITERAAQILKISRKNTSHAVLGLSQLPTYTRGLTALNVETLKGDSIAQEQPFLILDKITTDLPRSPLSEDVILKVKPYCLADPSFYKPQPVDVLLGASLFSQICTPETYSLGPDLPRVMGTKFGFVVMGEAPCAKNLTNDTADISVLSTSLLSTNDLDLHTTLQRFWQQEEPPMCSKKSEDEMLADIHFEKTHTRDSTGRYHVRLPFKADHLPLGLSRLAAEQRFNSLENKFRAKPAFKKLYVDFMVEYESENHMEKVEKPEDNTPHYYLPHHGVLKEASSTTKLRTVFDASCKTSSGVSLNEILLTGRKLQTNICDMLMIFRVHTVVFTCDIRQMYRQIALNTDDQNYHLILWRNDPSKPVLTYRLKTVTYGVNSSPFLAIKTLHQLADDEGGDFPEAAEILRTQTYVDDVIAGADSEVDAIRLQSQLISLLLRGGFELRKWASNSHSILKNLPEHKVEKPVFLQQLQQSHVSVLGLQWSTSSDYFTYSLNLAHNSNTKRQILSVIAQIYDPCGFLSPIVMWAKCYMQLLWSKGLGWDEPLPLDLLNKWKTFLSSLDSVKEIKIPRALPVTNVRSIELHGFSDASESGYAAVIYVRGESSNGSVTTRQIMSKTRVAPLKRVTLPRLELCGAHLLAQLVSYTLSVFKNKFKFSAIHLWCDSTVTLTWIATPPYRLKTYVANRVAQVQELVPAQSWKYIQSHSNPSDVASRGILPADLPHSDLWWQGPPWLSLSHGEWPIENLPHIDLITTDEIKTEPLTVLTTVPSPQWDVLTKFSSFLKLQRTMVYVLRFVHNIRHSIKKVGVPSSDELKEAEACIVKLVQSSSFAEEISSLKRSQSIPTRLRRLSPYLDTEGILRVGGRLSSSTLPVDSQHPVILPKKHYVVDLLIDHYHQMHLHCGAQLTQSLLALRFWILSARSVIRSRIFKCVVCFKTKPRNNPPQMGNLPSVRITPARPFLSTGMDYGGPFVVKVHNLRSSRHIKVYICVFVCMTTKAVHVEVVTDLTTDAFIAALTRFVSRRGLCTDLYSDCGTNFVGADRSLKKFIEAPETRQHIQNFSANRGIKFHFNPPAAPHQGGLWESAIKGTKHHLKRVIGANILTLLEFTTLTTQVEAMLNSRPLTPLSSDPTDLNPLTPGHFLIGAPLAAVPEDNLLEVPLNRLKQWHLVKALHQRLWSRWHLEYLHTLQQRVKWNTPVDNLKIGDLVLIHQSTPPLTWPLARIIGVTPGKDKVVRVVHLKTAQGTLTRPAVKVFPLPVNLD